jgi:phage gpG-like protein
MSKIFTLVEFAAHLKGVERDMEKLGPAIIRQACAMVAAEAKRVIGVGYKDWPALQPETLARKMMNTPLLESGAMRASIGWHAEGNEGHVGSNSDIAVFQERGTSRIPPRSFLAGAAQHMEDKIHKMAARAVVSVLAGGGLRSAELRELLHLIREVGHTLKDAAETITEEHDENGKRVRR